MPAPVIAGLAKVAPAAVKPIPVAKTLAPKSLTVLARGIVASGSRVIAPIAKFGRTIGNKGRAILRRIAPQTARRSQNPSVRAVATPSVGRTVTASPKATVVQSRINASPPTRAKNVANDLGGRPATKRDIAKQITIAAGAGAAFIGGSEVASRIVNQNRATIPEKPAGVQNVPDQVGHTALSPIDDPDVKRLRDEIARSAIEYERALREGDVKLASEHDKKMRNRFDELKARYSTIQNAEYKKLTEGIDPLPRVVPPVGLPAILPPSPPVAPIAGLALLAALAYLLRRRK